MSEFMITAWGPGGHGVFRVPGPVKPGRLFVGHSVDEDTLEIRPWTPDEDDFLIRFSRRKVAMKTIADRLNRTPGACYARRVKINKDMLL